ncbi:MAG: hypothetical protein HKM04_07800 [Legionellales bacterium]|nr:hypothetical protein [Legionellales bacterium]
MVMVIRAAELKDVDGIVLLATKLAEYEKKPPEAVKLTKEKMLEHGFGSHPFFQVRLQEPALKMLAASNLSP